MGGHEVHTRFLSMYKISNRRGINEADMMGPGDTTRVGGKLVSRWEDGRK